MCHWLFIGRLVVDMCEGRCSIACPCCHCSRKVPARTDLPCPCCHCSRMVPVLQISTTEAEKMLHWIAHLCICAYLHVSRIRDMRFAT